jgi:hypothetical protein
MMSDRYVRYSEKEKRYAENENDPSGVLKLFAKPEIINTSLEFVARFWVLEEKKNFDWTLRNKYGCCERVRDLQNFWERCRLLRFAGRTNASVPTQAHEVGALTQIHDHEFGLGHLFDCIAETFAAKT